MLIYFPSGKFFMCKYSKALDKTLKECRLVLCVGEVGKGGGNGGHGMERLQQGICKKTEQKENQKRGVVEKARQKSTQGCERQGAILCCSNHKQDIQSLELENNPNLLTKKHMTNT